jgi:gas vesicle protein GvpL/GvpF
VVERPAPVSPLYLYALLAEPPATVTLGLAGEPVRLVSCDGVLAAVGEVASAPPLDAPSLRAHDAAVRRLAEVSEAILPARFGSIAIDERRLCEGLRDRARELAAALETVRGCDQMTLRFSSTETPSPAEAEGPAAEPEGPAMAGPGTRYLAGRRAALGDPRRLPEVARVLDALAPCVRGERLERHDRPPLLASAYHLVPRDGIEAYRAALAAAAERAAVRVRASGPWPPYAFAPGALS